LRKRRKRKGKRRMIERRIWRKEKRNKRNKRNKRKRKREEVGPS